jgi:dienelactone hydrolase
MARMVYIADRMKWAALLVCAIACSSPAPDRSVEKPGPYAVGTARIEASDATTSYVMQTWYPTDGVVTDVPIEQLEAEPRRTTYRDLLAAAPDCPSRTLPVALDGAPLAGSFPLVVLSHCHSCTRLSNASTAIRLASHGFVAVSIDHTGDTLWDQLDGHSGSLDAAGLQRRVDDIMFALSMPPATADTSKIGILGHSFGGVTAGRVAQIDDRIVSAASLAAPMENPLIPGVTLAEIHKPVWFLVAKEDNSITEFGNKFIRDNFTAAPGEAWKTEVSDAGHWSVSDLDGLTMMFAPGCGDGVRQTDDTTFTYLDPAAGREISASYVTAFFKATLQDDAGARAYLDGEFFDGKVAVEHHD